MFKTGEKSRKMCRCLGRAHRILLSWASLAMLFGDPYNFFFSTKNILFTRTNVKNIIETYIFFLIFASFCC